MAEHAPSDQRPPYLLRRGVVATLLALALVGSACAPAGEPAARSGRNGGSDARANRPLAAQRVSATAVPATFVAGPEERDLVIQRVIERGNEQQVQAIASGSSAAMAETATSRHYQTLVRINQSLLDHGVVSIKLLKLEWGTVEVTGNRATVTAYETWRTAYKDGTTEESRDLNVYTLVLDGQTWRIDGDDHPDDTPAARPTPEPAPEPRSPAPQAPRGQNTSTNWSGYAASGGRFTSVSGSWTVPQPALDGDFGAAAAWVGVGGLRSRDLIQAGTQEVVSGTGRVTYTAWIETLPQSARTVPLAVAPGDSVSVSLTLETNDTWHVTLSNNSTGANYEEMVPYSSSLSSAEWIQEAPSVGRRGVVPVSNFGAIQFTNASTVKDGRTVDLGKAGARPVSLIGRDGQVLAVPSAVGADGASFSVERTDAPAASVSGFTPGRRG